MSSEGKWAIGIYLAYMVGVLLYVAHRPMLLTETIQLLVLGPIILAIVATVVVCIAAWIQEKVRH